MRDVAKRFLSCGDALFNIRRGQLMSCTCQGCGEQYRIDIIVPDEVWERIKPEGKSEGTGLLCGTCIIKRIEQKYGYEGDGVIEFELRRFEFRKEGGF